MSIGWRRRVSHQEKTRENSITSSRRFAVALAASVLFTSLTLTAVPPAHSAEGLTGRWSGSGAVVLPSGETEKARCKATFRKVGGREFAMDAVCATSSLRVAQTATLQAVGTNRFNGEFVNPEYNIAGSIKLTLSGNTLSASLNGGGGSAYFTLGR